MAELKNKRKQCAKFESRNVGNEEILARMGGEELMFAVQEAFPYMTWARPIVLVGGIYFCQ